MNRSLKAIFATLMLCLGFKAHANTFDIGGLEIDGAMPMVLQFTVADVAAVTGITFDFDYRPSAPSWSEELVIKLTHLPSNTTFIAGSPLGFSDYCVNLFGATCDADLGAPDNSSDPFIVVGLTFDLSLANGAGIWEITLGDGFDDAGADGFFDDGSTISINTAPVPIPAAVWLFASALLGLGGLRRRS